MNNRAHEKMWRVHGLWTNIFIKKVLLAFELLLDISFLFHPQISTNVTVFLTTIATGEA